MDKKLNLCCLFGGKSSEHEVSLVSAYSVLCNTDKTKYNIYPVAISKSGEWFYYTGDYEKIKDGSCFLDKENLFPAAIIPNGGYLHYGNAESDRPFGNGKVKLDVVFPVMHGTNCEDGKMQGYLDICGVPYVGPDCTSSAVCMDKAFTKQILRSYNIPMAKAIIVTKEDIIKTFAKIKFAVTNGFGYPVFVKPANAGSSIGVTKVTNEEQLEAAINNALIYDRKVLIEEAIVGKEVEVSVIGNEEIAVSVCGEIVPGADFYDYNTKYVSDTARYFIPARISEETAQAIQKYAKTIYKALGCKGLSRVDFFVRENGSPVFNEINTLPGFTPISMYPKLFMYDNMSYSNIIDSLISLALEKK